MGYIFPRAKKKKCSDLQRHFHLRCMERLGIIIHVDELKKRLQEHELKFIRRESNAKTHWLVPKDMLPRGFTRRVIAVYDSIRHQFVTVLYYHGKIFNLEDS